MSRSHMPEKTHWEIWPVLTRLKQHTGGDMALSHTPETTHRGDMARSHTPETTHWGDMTRSHTPETTHRCRYGPFSHA